MRYQRPNDGLNAAQRYRNKCDSITIRPLRSDGEKIRFAADAADMSLNQLIVVAVKEYIINHNLSANSETEDKRYF